MPIWGCEPICAVMTRMVMASDWYYGGGMMAAVAAVAPFIPPLYPAHTRALTSIPLAAPRPIRSNLPPHPTPSAHTPPSPSLHPRMLYGVHDIFGVNGYI